jgi:molybdate transport system substrate-binding protein
MVKQNLSTVGVTLWLVLITACSGSAEPVQAVERAGDETITVAAGPPALSEPVELTVFAAASLTNAFTEIGQNFSTRYPGVSLVYNFAGSQQLAQQLAQGAPADVFASANARQMDVTIAAGRVVSGTAQTFVRNRLVVIYSADNPAGLNQLADLAQPGLKLVLAAAEVPVGQYSLDFLDKAVQDAAFGPGYKEAVLQNVVSYEDNVRSVLAKISLGEGDAGIVYTSDISGAAVEQIGQIDIPDSLNTIATYPMAVISDALHPTHAQAFVDYILSPAGQEVLAKYGFISVSKL